MSPQLRAAARRRPWAQPLAFVFLALLYIWVVRPTRVDWLRIPLLAIIVLIPFASNFLHRDRLKEIGLRLDNLGRSGLEVGAATLVGAALVIAIGELSGAGLTWNGRVARGLLVYPIWGLAQQYAMQSFTYRRLRSALAPRWAAAAAATLFAALHYPNLALALVTLVGGYVWCRLFERQPNLITLALSHGWLAVLLRYSWPAEWLHNLRIGPGFWSWNP